MEYWSNGHKTHYSPCMETNSIIPSTKFLVPSILIISHRYDTPSLQFSSIVLSYNSSTPDNEFHSPPGFAQRRALPPGCRRYPPGRRPYGMESSRKLAPDFYFPLNRLAAAWSTSQSNSPWVGAIN